MYYMYVLRICVLKRDIYLLFIQMRSSILFTLDAIDIMEGKWKVVYSKYDAVSSNGVSSLTRVRLLDFSILIS